jgi:hypothetical protein
MGNQRGDTRAMRAGSSIRPTITGFISKARWQPSRVVTMDKHRPLKRSWRCSSAGSRLHHG